MRLSHLFFFLFATSPQLMDGAAAPAEAIHHLEATLSIARAPASSPPSTLLFFLPPPLPLLRCPPPSPPPTFSLSVIVPSFCPRSPHLCPPILIFLHLLSEFSSSVSLKFRLPLLFCFLLPSPPLFITSPARSLLFDPSSPDMFIHVRPHAAGKRSHDALPLFPSSLLAVFSPPVFL